MFQESKDELALILYGTDETNNDLADENNYQNINLVFSLSPANWQLFEEIQKIRPGNNPADCKYKLLSDSLKKIAKKDFHHSVEA
jgi:ATP-dependent DNA helicase 2 subunit 2